MSGPFGSSQWMYNSGEDYQVGKSLRFNNPDSAHLARAISTASNRRTFTISIWAKRAILGTSHQIMGARDGSTFSLFYFSNHRLLFYSLAGGNEYQAATNALFRDNSAWYHIVLAVDTTQGTQSNRVKIYVNGVQQSLSGSDYPENFDSSINSTIEQQIGRQSTGADHYDGLFAEMHFVDGAALAPTSFGEFGIYGEWKPIDCKDDLTYGTHGFYLDFASSGVGTASSSTVGADRSGNDNHYTSTNVAATDQMLDTCTNNFATYDEKQRRANLTNPTYSEGNLRMVHPNLSGNAGFGVSTIGVKSGKYYVEILAEDVVTNFGIGIATMLQWNGDGNRNSYIKYKSDGDIKKYTNTQSSEASYTDGDILAIAFDITNLTVAFYKNNALQDTVSSIDAGFEDTYYVLVQASTNDKHIANFGQDSSFAGEKTAQGNSDGNGIGDFYYTPPSGFLALCAKNLPTPVIVPSQHFNTVLYTGDDGQQSITGVGFQPDFIWFKARNDTYSHEFFDVVRGNTKRLISNTTAAEDTRSTATTFDSDGFTVGTGGDASTNDVKNYAAFNWKAGNANTAFSESGNNPGGTHRANVDAGFSIVSYTGTGAAGTVAHGLGVAPELMLIKNRDVADEWYVYYGDNTDYLVLDDTDATADSATAFNDTSPTATVFTVNTSHSVNADGEKYIAYCWRSIDGFSKVGEYVGNGNAVGTFINTGFRPAWIMVKRFDSTGNWILFDNKRQGYNLENDYLYANSSDAEADGGSSGVDLVSSGFKIRNTYGDMNVADGNYIYLAFAETPFKYANAR